MRTIETTLGPISVAEHMYDDWLAFFKAQNMVTEEVIVLPEQRAETTQPVNA